MKRMWPLLCTASLLLLWAIIKILFRQRRFVGLLFDLAEFFRHRQTPNTIALHIYLQIFIATRQMATSLSLKRKKCGGGGSYTFRTLLRIYAHKNVAFVNRKNALFSTSFSNDLRTPAHLPMVLDSIGIFGIQFSRKPPFFRTKFFMAFVMAEGFNDDGQQNSINLVANEW